MTKTWRLAYDCARMALNKSGGYPRLGTSAYPCFLYRQLGKSDDEIVKEVADAIYYSRVRRDISCQEKQWRLQAKRADGYRRFVAGKVGESS